MTNQFSFYTTQCSLRGISKYLPVFLISIQLSNFPTQAEMGLNEPPARDDETQNHNRLIFESDFTHPSKTAKGGAVSVI